MKKILNISLALAAAVIAMSSCQKNTVDASAEQDDSQIITFNAVAPATKTVFTTPNGSNYPVIWTASDTTIRVCMNAQTVKTAKGSGSTDGTSASFSVSFTKPNPAPASYTFYSMSPANTNSIASGRWGIIVPSTQTPLSGSCDSAAQILVAKSTTTESIPEQVSFEYTHFTAYGLMSFTNLNLGDATVSSVSLTADSNIVGSWYYTMSGENEGKIEANSASKTLTVNTSSTSDIWFAVAPAAITSLTVVVNTDKGTFTKEITGLSKEFKSGKIARFNVDMSGITAVSPKVYNLVTSTSELTPGSKVIIAASNANYALSTAQNENNRGAAGITKTGSTVMDPATAVEVFTVGRGTNTGTISLKGKDGKYIYASGSGSGKNYLKSKAELDANGSWVVTITDGVFTVKADVPKINNTMRYNPSGSILFSCYSATSSTGSTVVFYKEAGSGNGPYINVDNASATVTAEAGSTTFTYSVLNSVSGQNVSASTDAGWITSCTCNNGTLTVVYEANSGTADRKATITLSCDGADDATVTLTQSKPAPVIPTYGSLAELVAAGEPKGQDVTVTLTDETIKSLVKNSSGTYTNGIMLSGGSRDIEIYCHDVPSSWVAGGTVSGTITGEWKDFNGTWEVCPENWDGLAYTAPEGGGTPSVFASLSELVAAGTPTVAGTQVTVTLTDEAIKSLVKNSSGEYTNGIMLSGGSRDIEIYCHDVPSSWVAGGKVSGTVTGTWKDYNGTWEIEIASWAVLSYTAPQGGGGESGTYTASLTISNFNGGKKWDSYVNKTAIVKGTDNNNYTIEGSNICYNDNYICVQHEESTTHEDKKNYWKEPHGDIDYYILSVDGTVYGPYSEADYSEKIEELQIYGLSDWIRPDDLPKKY